MGELPGKLRISRGRALTDAVSGFFANLDPLDGEGLDDQARARWARDEIAKLIDAELAFLEEAREALDPEAMELDRLEAPDRALFDPSREMVLARKYEAATERGMHKALKEFREVQAAADASDATSTKASVSESVASFEIEPEALGESAGVGRVLPRRSLPPTDPTATFPVLRILEGEFGAVEVAEMALC